MTTTKTILNPMSDVTQTPPSRPILTRFASADLHWVGDGFLTQSLLPYQHHAHDTSPFLLAGYNPPRHFAPSETPKGVGMHPHRGFETVTLVFQGGVAHGDTMGNRGEIFAGDVQWMTAGSGVQHEEFHAADIARDGGTLEMVQLWVNLPAAEKGTAPRYQTLTADRIPTQDLGQGAKLRVIAGDYEGVTGPARTASPLQLWDVYLPAGGRHHFARPAGESLSLVMLSGDLELNGTHELHGAQSVIFTRDAGGVDLRAETAAHYLVMAGQPLDEPIAMSGPFVMYSEDELRAAYRDYRAGKF